jgi:phosphatidyl-myo-inositol alpha-mannosyltransferase
VTRQLKVGFVLDTSLDPPDGVQQYILRLGEWMTAQGHNVHYLVGETKRTDIPNVHSLSKNVTVTFNGNKMTVPLWAHGTKVKQLLAKEQFDVLHVQSPYHPLMAQYVLRKNKTAAVVSTFHILPYGKVAAIANRLLGITLKPSLKRVDSFLSVSGAAAVFQKQTFGVASKVLPNVFDYTRFAKAQPLLPEDDRITILFLGRLVERKGCQYLLHALAKLDLSSLPKIRVVVCGKGVLLPELQSYVASHGLADIVEFAGFVSEDEKPGYYASADISVFPSTSGESFGIVLLEAMASGRSGVLAGNNPGYATVMQPRPDLLVEPKDIDIFATKLQELILNSAKRKQAAEWGKEYVRGFDVAVVGPKLISEYEMAIASRNKKQHNKD